MADDQITSEAERVERFEGQGVEQESQNDPYSSRDDDGDTRDLEEAHITIQMEALDPNWVSKINDWHLVEPRRSEVSWTSISCSIHRVPRRFLVRNQNAYNPHVLSIGPFHYEKRQGQLKFMEEHKRRYLNDILSRNKGGSLEQYFVAIKQLEESARRCYSEVIELDSYSFVEMLVLDGCFIIELFRKDFLDEHIDDPIFVLKWLEEAVMADLLMLENQIPFFILQRLFELTMTVTDTNVTTPSSNSLVQWALHYCCGEQASSVEEIMSFRIQIQHLLHLLHTNYVVLTTELQSEQDSVPLIPSASKLEEGGIKFRLRDVHYTSHLDIKFENGVLEIPVIEVSDHTNIKFRNFVAFEQCYRHCKKYFTAYATFMDYLIDNSEDVEILCREEIIENWLGSNEDLAAFFNNLGREVIVYKQDFCLADVCGEINRYCWRAWPKLRASLVHDYFKNPWAIISFIAALLLLLLTLTQTFFAAFPKFANGR